MTNDLLKTLSINQIKKFRTLLDKAITENEGKIAAAEQARNDALSEIGNLLHESVPISNDEVIVTGCKQNVFVDSRILKLTYFLIFDSIRKPM